LFFISHVSFPLATILAVFLFLRAAAVKLYRIITGRSDEEGQIKPKTVLITGASSGIGEGLALSYAKDKCTVILLGRDKGRLENVRKACSALGGHAIPVIVDVTDEKLMSQTMKELDQKHELDLVIANAGITANMLPDDMSFELKTKQIFRTNIDGVFNTVLPVVDSFKARGRGQFAFVSSISGVLDFPKNPAYSCSKSCLITFSQHLREVLRGYHVSVCCITPGFVRSAMTDARTEKTGSPMPFFWETDRAVEYIKAGLRNDEGVISFPLPLYSVAYIISILPPFILETLFKVANINKNMAWNRVG